MSSATSIANDHFWHSPMPFLFGGLAIIIALISAVIVILACSRKNSSLNLSSEDQQENPAARLELDMAVLDEPKIVVIMAGDNLPTYIAMPEITFSTTTCCEQV
ncbi:hypothetical protein JCGZ_25630 [Jatropha curcas]|uniref:Uncharacterized protein n=1 Tax=Jatropha curcas TaxID=180498 RepID=A0A067JXR6_JATCU|nr:hypothetical protein JCGZ_25630 [Jatropha curcas]